MGIAGAELHVVADHEDGHAPRRQRPEDGCQFLLELRVQPLGGLVQQQYLRVKEQHLTQRRPLLLTAGQVVGMPVQQLRQPAQRHRLGDALLLQRRVYPLPVEHLVQVLPDGLFHEQRLGILGQRPDAARAAHLTPLGPQRPRQQVQTGGLARAVAAQQRHKLAPVHRNVQALYHVRQRRLIAKEQSPSLQHRLAPGGAHLLRQGPQRMILVPYPQEIPALPHGDGAIRAAADAGPHPHGGGHGQKHPVAAVAELTAHLRRCAGTQQPAAVQHRHVRGQGQRLLQPVLRQEHRCPQLPVDAAQRLQKVRGRDGVKLAGGLVQN